MNEDIIVSEQTHQGHMGQRGRVRPWVIAPRHDPSSR